MPNWISNLLLITGSREDRKEMLDLIMSEERDFDFNNVIPMPEDLNIVSVSDPNEELKAKYQSNLEKYDYKDWYDWQVGRWGCKWGAADVAIKDGYWTTEIQFRTPYNPPFPIYEELGKRFPNLTMVFYYDDWWLNGMGIKRDGDSSFLNVEERSDTTWHDLDTFGNAAEKDDKGVLHWKDEAVEDDDDPLPF